jgi:hypothetical protein
VTIYHRYDTAAGDDDAIGAGSPEDGIQSSGDPGDAALTEARRK